MGGEDLFLHGPVLTDDRIFILRALKALWPRGVIEDALSDEGPLPLAKAVAQAPAWEEVLAFRTSSAQKTCEKFGVVPSLGPDFLHLLFGPDGLTVVVHEAVGKTRSFVVDELFEGLANHRLRSNRLPLVA